MTAHRRRQIPGFGDAVRIPGDSGDTMPAGDMNGDAASFLGSLPSASRSVILSFMPRKPRIAPGGWVYHVLNRSVGRMKMFRHDRDVEAFQRVLAEARQRHPLRILSYCIMPPTGITRRLSSLIPSRWSCQWPVVRKGSGFRVLPSAFIPHPSSFRLSPCPRVSLYSPRHSPPPHLFRPLPFAPSTWFTSIFQSPLRIAAFGGLGNKCP
jgi:hypothetical protein